MLEQVSGVIRALQASMVVININFKTLTILAKRLILVAWLGPGRTSADGYITVLKIQMELCKDGRGVKTGSF